MPLERWLDESRAHPGAPGLRALDLDSARWRDLALDVAAAGGRLLALWGSRAPDLSFRASAATHAAARTEAPAAIHAVVIAPPTALAVRIPLVNESTGYPGIADIFPAAGRMQRAVFDLCGLRAAGDDTRPWLRHAAWKRDVFPLADRTLPAPLAEPVDDYAFVRVAGDGVHEIPVGPVHAGIIEPGHFRFSVVGEKVLRLEERLGYVHKGIERRFTELPVAEGHRLAARVSGDSAVAYSWAYCQALEGMAAVEIPARGAWLRALALEIERIANHLGDLGALGNDAGFAFGLAQFSRLKEQLLRASERALGQRYLLDFVVPGGVRLDLEAPGAAELLRCAASLVAEVDTLRGIYEEHAGVRDRFLDAGTLPLELASRLGVVGLVGRASRQLLDLRLDLPCEPYGRLGLRRCVQESGDVLARVTLRFDELMESLRVVDELLAGLPTGPCTIALPTPADGAAGVGAIEGWRGPVVVGLEAGRDGRIRRCHPHDPSWHNWPALEHAIIGNIVPDFPLINKSFNLSYSGHDL